MYADHYFCIHCHHSRNHSLQSFTQSFTFAHICRPSLLPHYLRIWRVHHCTKVHQMFWVIIFSVGTRQFGTWLTFKYSFSLSCWTYGHFIFALTAHICRPSLLPQFLHICWVHYCTTLHQKFWVIIFSSGTRHFGTNLMKNSWKSSMKIRYICMFMPSKLL